MVNRIGYIIRWSITLQIALVGDVFAVFVVVFVIVIFTSCAVAVSRWIKNVMG
jgi:hypothetical protein